MSSANYTDIFLDSIFSVMEEGIPEESFDELKKCLYDYFGVLLAGRMLIKNEIPAVDNGAYHNALKLGILSHAAELDDGHRIAMVHAGSTVISAMIAAAEKYGFSPRQFCIGVVTGYEAAVRLSCAIQPTHKTRGFHVTGTAGLMGAAAGIAAAAGFDREMMRSVLSSAGCLSGGLLEVCESGSMLKPFNSGKSSLSAILAVDMAMNGFNGPKDIMGGKRGYLRAFSDDPDPSWLGREPNEKLMIHFLYRKQYAACRYCHAPLESALAIKNEHSLEIEDIESIEIDTFSLAIPGHDYTDVDSPQSAKMSIPFSMAMAMKTGSASIGDYCDENISDERVIALSRKVILRSDDELSALVPAKRGAIVTIKTKDGSVYTKKTDNPKGEPEIPLSADEIIMKFKSLADFSGADSEMTECILDSVENIMDEEKYNWLIERTIKL